MRLDQSSVVPLYRQLKEILSDQIQSGQLQPGDQLPPEPIMCEQYEVSRITVRKAILELVDEQILVRKQGKGTFVAKKLDSGNIVNASFTESCAALGLALENQVLQLREQPAGEDDARVLGAALGEDIVFLERLRIVDKMPIRIDRTYFAPDYSAVMNEDLQRLSVFQTIRNRYGIYSLRQKSQIDIAFTDSYTAALLELPLGEPVLCMQSVVSDELGKPVFRTHIYHVSQRLALVI